MTPLRALPLIATLGISVPVAALDGISLVGGDGEDARMAAIGLVWHWERRWFTEGDWFLGGYWEADLSYWRGDDPEPEDIYGIGVTPVLRLERVPVRGLAPYLEAGIGAHLFSQTRINAEERMGTAFEFGSLGGVGVRFGPELGYELGYRYQHFSNAGISDNNGGVNFHQLRFQVSF